MSVSSPKVLLYWLLLEALNGQPQDRIRVDPVVFEKGESCPSSNQLQAAVTNFSEVILLLLNITCGESGWTQVIDLDMSDPSQQCPSPWDLFDTPVRSCSEKSLPGCKGFSVPVPTGTYFRVCGQVTGYATRTPDAFINRGDIDSGYLDGVSLTHGSPRQHIWSFAAGHPSRIQFGGASFRCPCDNTDRSTAPLPPSFVGDNYFCDGEYNGALWDGEDCTTNCCTFNSPPYFTTTLPAPTSDDIEVRICGDQEMSNEPVHVSHVLLYVQ